MSERAGSSGIASMRGRFALVAGAAGGIGGCAATALSEAGAQVTGVDLPGRAVPPGIRPEACDLTDPDAVRDLVGRLAAREGRLDALVHCAGITRDRILWKMDDDGWRHVMSVNLDSAFYLLREAAPLLRRAGGAVVLVSSINGERGKVGQANYAASKAGLIGLGRTAARELGSAGVRVNVVSPGLVRTPMTEGLPEETIARAAAESALGRIGDPRDVAGAILFLCSDMSRHITGQVLRVDGGQLIA